MSLAKIDHDLLLASILETAPSAIVVMDVSGRILSFSPAGETMFGWMHDDIEGGHVTRLMLPEDAAMHDAHVQRYIKTGEAHIIGRPRALRARHRDGQSIAIRLAVGEFFQDGVRHFVGIIEDLTPLDDARRKLAVAERSLDRMSRLTAMGTLASIIAHDLNQPLTGAASLVEAVEMRLSRHIEDADAPDRAHLRMAADEIRRAGTIVQRVRSLIERGEPERHYADLGEAVREACLIATAGALEPGTRLELALSEAVPPVFMDRIQIQQVVVNLVRNALDAVRGLPEGTISVATRAEQATAILEVTDNGPGIPKEAVDQVFDAFMTTKRDGLGLGLAIARSIVEAHGGTLTVEEGAAEVRTMIAVRLPIGAAPEAGQLGRSRQ